MALDVVLLVKPPRLGDAFLREFLVTGTTRGHRVRAVEKSELVGSTLEGVDVVCLKNHVDDATVWRVLDAAGVRAVNRRLSCSRRVEVDALARAAGIRTPRSAGSDREVKDLSYPVIRKPASVYASADVVVLDRPPERPDCATYQYQELLPRGGVTSKVYGIGSDAFLVEEPDPGPGGTRRHRRAAVIPDVLVHAARAAGAATGLEVFGLDFVGLGDDQYLVDVNPFPSFRHVPQAASTLWTHLELTS